MNEKQKVIYEIQDYLRNISYYNEKIPFIVSDGIYGDETAEAVKAFQQEYSIEESGEVDLETFRKLTEVNALAVMQPVSPFNALTPTEKDLPLKKGDEGIFVHQLNLMLRRIGEKFSNFTQTSAYDIFDSETEKQVRRWQTISALSPTGEVDKLTWNSLASLRIF